ncbi:MAG TPA: SDR family oxidoreductase [bacterium]|nr:SDR family oxidoreductase [bacterium]
MMTRGPFQGRVVVVTGGARGIGLCLVDTFARRGARVAFADIDAAAGRFWERRLAAQGAEVRFFRADLGRAADVRRFARAALRAFGRADVLINNVGITDIRRPFLRRSLADWNRTLAVNLTSYFLCAQLFAPALARARGAIINIASTRALMSEPNTEAYAASKGGIVALTHALAVTLGPRVLVHCVSPGWIDTSAWRRPPRPPRLRPIDHRQHPAGRVGLPEDVAALCLFLADRRAAGFITGQNYLADGGMTRKMIYA